MRKIKSGDKVQVISWKHSGAISTVDKVVEEDKVVVNWVNVVKKAVKWQGFLEKTLPIHISNVMVYCWNCNKPVRVNRTVNKNWKKVRTCKKCEKEVK